MSPWPDLFRPTGFLPRTSVPIIAAFVLISLSAIVVAAETPPRLPSPEARAHLIAAESEAGIAQAIGPPRMAHDEYDVTHYDIALDFDIPNEILTGSVSVDLAVKVPDLSQLEIDLYECMTIDDLLVDGSPAFFTRADGVVTITLGSVHQPDDSINVSCSYHGTPDFPSQPNAFRWNVQNGVPMILTYSEPYAAPAWWLCKDDPKDKATYGIHLTVPDTLVAVSNGLLDSVDDNGDGTKTYNWTTDYPMSPYLFSVAITNFDSWTEVYTALDGETTMDVTYWAFPADLADAQVSWSRNLEMMDYYVSIFGEYPFLDEKYGIAEYQRLGAMEHQTCTSMSYYYVDGTNDNDFVVAHELSHAWVGDMITMTEWSHAWCKEGFATYCEALYFEDKYGESYYHSYMGDMDALGYGLHQLYGIEPPLHAAIYFKGAWVLHMLRHVIGDAAFFDAIRGYVDEPDFRYAVADTDDMCASFEETTGIELRWFFDQWIYNPGYPLYEIGWSAQEAEGGYDLTVAITQSQSEPVFKMPIDLKVVTYQGSETFTVWDSLRGQMFDLHVTGQPIAVVLDPDRWIIRQVQPMGVEETDQLQARCLAVNYPNPFSTETTIKFYLPNSGRVDIDIFDLAGRRVVRLLGDSRPAGHGIVEWNGTDSRGRPVSPGVYFCRLSDGKRETLRRMMRLR